MALTPQTAKTLLMQYASKSVGLSHLELDQRRNSENEPGEGFVTVKNIIDRMYLFLKNFTGPNPPLTLDKETDEYASHFRELYFQLKTQNMRDVEFVPGMWDEHDVELVMGIPKIMDNAFTAISTIDQLNTEKWQNPKAESDANILLSYKEPLKRHTERLAENIENAMDGGMGGRQT